MDNIGNTIWSASSYRDIRNDPAASDWLKTTLESALRRDPVDVVNDTEAMLQVLKHRLDALRTHGFHCRQV